MVGLLARKSGDQPGVNVCYVRNLVKQVIEIVSFSAFNRAPEALSLGGQRGVAAQGSMCDSTNNTSIELLA